MMEKVLKEKLQNIVSHVNNTMVDPDIEVTYCIPEVEMNAQSCEVNAKPYILVQYNEDKYTERKIRLSEKYLESSAEDVANYVTFSIEQYKEEVDSLKYGAQ